MSISLKNISDRVTALENKSTAHGDTGWINGTRASNFYQTHSKGVDPIYRKNIFRYRVVNNIMFIEVSGVCPTDNTGNGWFKLGVFPKWTYGELWVSPNGSGFENGAFEGKLLKIDSSGNVYDMTRGGQWRLYVDSICSCPLNK